MKQFWKKNSGRFRKLSLPQRRGFILLYALFMVSVLLSITSTIASSSVSELRFSRDEDESLKAFYAADTGIECARYLQEKFGAFNSTVAQSTYNCGVGGDFVAPFDVSSPTEQCNDTTTPFHLEGLDSGACVDVTVTTSQDPENVGLCRVSIQSSGQSSCSGGEIISERTRWEDWTGLQTGVGSIDSGIVAHWALDDGSGTVAGDTSGNNFNGTLVNGPNWATGVIGGSLEFDGVSDAYVQIADSNALDLADDYTISAWIFPRSWGENSEARVVDKGGGSGTLSSGWMFGINNTSEACTGAPEAYRFLHNFDTASKLCGTNGSVELNRWQMITVTYSNGTMVGYVDDAFDKQTTGVSDVTGNSTVVRIGQRGDDLLRDFDGFIDDVRIYDRALTPAEVQALYLLGS